MADPGGRPLRPAFRPKILHFHAVFYAGSSAYWLKPSKQVQRGDVGTSAAVSGKKMAK